MATCLPPWLMFTFVVTTDAALSWVLLWMHAAPMGNSEAATSLVSSQPADDKRCRLLSSPDSWKVLRPNSCAMSSKSSSNFFKEVPFPPLNFAAKSGFSSVCAQRSTCFWVISNMSQRIVLCMLQVP
jgi:hypothetical protein